MKNLVSIISLAVTLIFWNIGLAHGELVTDVGSIPTPYLVVDFSQFTTRFYPPASPVQIGALVGKNITMEGCADYGNISYSLGYFMHDPPQNGYWRGPAFTSPGLYFTTYTSGQTGGPGMTFHFNDGPVSAVGAFVNYDPYYSAHPTITALDINGQDLESYDLASAAPISTPSAENQGGFRGIVRSQADIYGFRYGNGYLVLTDLTFTASKPGGSPAMNLLLLED